MANRDEVFRAECALCHEVIDAVRREVGSSFEVIVRDMMDVRVVARAEKFSIRSIPAVVPLIRACPSWAMTLRQCISLISN
jgi:hypothetical protein